eukprot:m.354053 g.354053  ORF g.354053 m.354053 type:complete len:426 (-) comp16909_c0_seq1:2225-3502(-)
MAFYTAGPNEALVVSGCCYAGSGIHPGGRVFVLPCIQKVQRLSLNLMTLAVESPRIYTQKGVPVSVTGIAQVKVASSQDMLAVACQQFLDKSEDEIKAIILETLEGHQRAIMGTMTVEEIYQDRQKFSVAVFEVASKDLINMGMTVVSYTLQNVSDEVGYLKALGQTRTAEVQRDATIGAAVAHKESGIKSAQAKQAAEDATYRNMAEVAQSQRDYKVKQAEFNMEISEKKATADLAKPLQKAITHQKIRNEEVGVMLVERQKQIQVMEQEIIRKERSLEATVKQPAKAEKYKMETIAEADRQAAVYAAEAEAESIRLKGEAEAFAIQAKAEAEAEALQKKADAFAKYKDAAVLDMVLEMLPKVAAEIAAPLSAAEKITMVAGPNGEVGASKLTGEVLEIMDRIPQTVQSLTGIDMQKGMTVSLV